MRAKVWLLKKYLDIIQVEDLLEEDSDSFCNAVEEEGLCHGINCEDCPLLNMTSLVKTVGILLKGEYSEQN